MDVLIAGSLLSLLLCDGALLAEWRLLSPGQRGGSASKPGQG
jgi:hypothetical protein